LAALRTVPAVDGRVDLQDDVAVLAGTPLHREAKSSKTTALPLNKGLRIQTQCTEYGIVVHN
jgi:hypothetical protein